MRKRTLILGCIKTAPIQAIFRHLNWNTDITTFWYSLLNSNWACFLHDGETISVINRKLLNIINNDFFFFPENIHRNNKIKTKIFCWKRVTFPGRHEDCFSLGWTMGNIAASSVKAWHTISIKDTFHLLWAYSALLLYNVPYQLLLLLFASNWLLCSWPEK